jgi:hypothetical protein
MPFFRAAFKQSSMDGKGAEGPECPELRQADAVL